VALDEQDVEQAARRWEEIRSCFEQDKNSFVLLYYLGRLCYSHITGSKDGRTMIVDDKSLEQIVTQVAQLPFNERLRLIHRIIDTLPQRTEQGQHVFYGQFRGEQMSTEEDFRLAELGIPRP
jgi:hypothetical protein